YRAYGTEILAVADGVVTQTKDGIPQNIPNKPPVVPITLETIGGNHVIMEIGNGLYAFYAHIQPGSIRVKVGDNVRRGQVLGLLGNSGNSTEPHLHFHICNANSELGCEGLPYAFAEYELQGKGESWKSSDSRSSPNCPPFLPRFYRGCFRVRRPPLDRMSSVAPKVGSSVVLYWDL